MPAKNKYKKINSKKYTRFEKARLLVLELYNYLWVLNLCKVTEDDDPIDIALAEFKENVYL